MLAGITGKCTFKFTIFHINVTSVIYKILARYAQVEKNMLKW